MMTVFGAKSGSSVGGRGGNTSAAAGSGADGFNTGLGAGAAALGADGLITGDDAGFVAGGGPVGGLRWLSVAWPTGGGFVGRPRSGVGFEAAGGLVDGGGFVGRAGRGLSAAGGAVVGVARAGAAVGVVVRAGTGCWGGKPGKPGLDFVDGVGGGGGFPACGTCGTGPVGFDCRVTDGIALGDRGGGTVRLGAPLSSGGSGGSRVTTEDHATRKAGWRIPPTRPT